MTKVQRRSYIALGQLYILCIAAAVSFAQKTAGDNVQTSIDLFAVLPASDALIVVDIKHILSDAVPRILVDDQNARALFIGVADSNSVDLLDARAIQRVVVGFRYGKDEKNPTDFDVVTIAETGEAGQLPTVIKNRGAGKYQEQQYAGKTLYVTQVQESESKEEATNSDENKWAVVALDANTLAFGSPVFVRTTIDVNAGKGTKVNADLVADVKRNSKALISAAGQLPPALISVAQQMTNSDFSQTLSSLKYFHASIELIPTGLNLAVTLNGTSAEQTRGLVDLLGAFKTIGSVSPGKTKQDKVARDLIKGLMISAEGTELQIKNEIMQASIDELAKHFSARMYFQLGLAYVQTGYSDKAIDAYDKAITLDPENPLTFINRGKARADKGTLDAAIADYDKAISMDPDSALAYNNRCFTRLQKRDFDAAIVDCDKAIEIDPTFAFPYSNRGLAFASLGKLDKAMADYDKSIALDGENRVAYQNRGDARVRMQNWDGAIADFEKCITIDAKSAQAYNGRGVARYYKGELDQALTDYDKAIALDPKLAEAYGNRALCLLALHKDSQAEKDLKKCFELNESLRSVYDAEVKDIKKTRH